MQERAASHLVKLNKEEERICRHVLVEILIYVGFLIVTTIVVLLPRSFYMYYFHKTIENIFLNSYFTGKNYVEITFSEITSVEDWWAFIKAALFQEIYERNVKEFDNFRSLHESIFLGSPRIRQLIVKNGSCEVHEDFKKHFYSCYGPYNFKDLDTEDRDNSTFSTSSEIDNIDALGILHYYDGGGYVEYFSFDRNETKQLLTRLIKDEWIERGTRLIVFEFTLYNANVNLFCLVKFLAEQPPIGGIIPSFDIRTYRLIELWSWRDYLFFSCYCLFIVLIFYYTIEEIIDIVLLRWRYLTFVWNWIDLAVIVIGYVSVGLTVFRILYMKKILKKFNENPDKYLSLENIALVQFYYTNIMGICAFLVWIKILKYLSFWKVMVQFSTTLQRCAKDLLAFGVMFAIAFVAFAQLGFLLFGYEVKSFRNFGESIFTMMRALLGEFDYVEVQQANRILGPMFFIFFILFVFFILLNMFLAIINDTYSAVKSEVSAGSIHLGAYVKLKLARMCKWCCCGRDICKLRDAEEEEEDVGAVGDAASSKPPKPGPKPSPSPSSSAPGPRIEMTLGVRSLIDKYYETTDSRRPSPDSAQLDRLTQRVNRLEQIMDHLVDKVDALVTRLDKTRLDNAPR